MNSSNTRLVFCLLVITIFIILFFKVDIINAFYFWGMVASIAAVFKLLEEKRIVDSQQSMKNQKLVLERKDLCKQNNRFLEKGGYLKLIWNRNPFSSTDKEVTQFEERQRRIKEIDIETGGPTLEY